MPLAEEFELLFPKVNPPWEVSSVALTSNLPPPFPSHLIPFELSLPPFVQSLPPLHWLQLSLVPLPPTSGPLYHYDSIHDLFL